MRWEGNGFVVLESCLDDGKHVRTVCYASGAQSFNSRRPFDHSSSSAGIPASKSLNFASSPTQRKGSLPVCPETYGLRCRGWECDAEALAALELRESGFLGLGFFKCMGRWGLDAGFRRPALV